MTHRIALTPEQISALKDWAYDGPHAAPVLLDTVELDGRLTGAIYAGQGEERVIVNANGAVLESA